MLDLLKLEVKAVSELPNVGAGSLDLSSLTRVVCPLNHCASSLVQLVFNLILSMQVEDRRQMIQKVLFQIFEFILYMME